MTRRWTSFTTALSNNPWLLSLYYLGIVAGLVWLYGKGNFTPPKFIYQGF
ncbi:MAG: hypothetical protein ACM3XM_11850 [Mycobacterium leprae]